MTGRVLAACLPLLLLSGCLEEHPTRLVSGGPLASSPLLSSSRQVSRAPATEATAQRVMQVGQKLVTSNQQMGIRPVFVTVGAPHPEVFHRGNVLEGHQVIVSEGLVARCANDAQLAAVLSLELGKIISEREALASPAARDAARRPPPSENIGSDSGGTFGPPDGTRMMELARYDRQRRRPGAAPKPPPAPEALARGYLNKAGFDAETLTEVAPLLRQAEDHFTVERQLGDGARR